MRSTEREQRIERLSVHNYRLKRATGSVMNEKDERRPTYDEATHAASNASQQGDDTAMRADIRDSEGREKHYSDKCIAASRDYAKVNGRFSALRDYHNGLLIEFFVLASFIAVGIEWAPSRLVAYAYDVTDPVQLNVLTLGIAVLGWVIGLFLGDLSYQHRKAQEHTTLHWVSVTVALVAAVIYLLLGYENRLVYTTIVAQDAKSPLLEPWILSLSLTGLSAVGIALAFLAGANRESLQRAELRWKRARLRRALDADKRRLDAARREVRECKQAHADLFPPGEIVGKIESRDGCSIEYASSEPRSPGSFASAESPAVSGMATPATMERMQLAQTQRGEIEPPTDRSRNHTAPSHEPGATP